MIDVHNREDQHKYAVTSASWYPFDTGMFVTSSYDTTIKVWDTNTMKVGDTKTEIYMVHVDLIQDHSQPMNLN